MVFYTHKLGDFQWIENLVIFLQKLGDFSMDFSIDKA